MTKIKMTIHRALAELKLIDSRIEKSITMISPTGLQQNGKMVGVNVNLTEDEFKAEAKSKYQSVTALIDRKMLIKSAIVKANGETIVTIGYNEMSISDAITFKQIIEFKKQLILSLASKHSNVMGKLNTKNEEVNKVALDNAKIMIGKQDDGSVKPTDEDVKAIVEPFVKRNEYHLIDPLKIEALTEKLQEEVDEFDVEVDAVLSEINAITIIEI